MVNIGDIIELTVDIPERHHRAGEQGTIVHCHSSEAFEVEFTNQDGETVELLALSPKQFIVVWRSDTEQWVSVVEQVSELIAKMPDESAREVLDFARYLSVHNERKMASSFGTN